MKQRAIFLLLVLCLLLNGCSWSGNRYVSVTPHQGQKQSGQRQAASAANSLELMQVLEELIEDGAENGVIYIAEYPAEYVDNGMEVAVDYATKTYPLGAYAVEDIGWEVGTTGGLPAMAVSIVYRHSDAEIRQIRDVAEMEDIRPLVAAALKDYDARLVMRVAVYFERDFQQMVQDFADSYPEILMEVPQVTAEVYGSGAERVVELSFAYQTSRDSLRQMQSQVMPVFEAAELYVSGDGAQRQKYSQLYAFLMERFDYQVETSITPAYSLLHHGVGDSRAFATVYAAMCRRAGLDCQVVTGTRSGEPWTWNIVQVSGVYRHVDLLQCSSAGRFQEKSDGEMTGYVWDYSAYPECPVIRAPEPAGEGMQVSETEPEAKPETEPTEPVQETQEPTASAETEPTADVEEFFEEI